MMEDGFLATLALKLLGAVAGAVLALVFLPPKTRTEFIRRAALSVIAGIIFGDPVHEWLKWPDTWQMNLAASAGTAMVSWFAAGAVVRVIASWKPSDKGE